jgi:hypothetical protein
VVDAYGAEEQTGGFFTMIEEHLALPFSVSILGVEAVVDKVDMTRDGRIVAVCRHGYPRLLFQPTPPRGERPLGSFFCACGDIVIDHAKGSF